MTGHVPKSLPESWNENITIVRWLDLPHPETHRAAVEAIFFETGGTKTFATEEARAEFLERWLGRYFANDPHHLYIAQAPRGPVVGYLAGSLDDPAINPRFADLSYVPDFAHLSRAYPAHLHINLTETARNQGIGAALVATFVRDAATAGAPGVHVVTGAGMRNVGFYTRNGFAELGQCLCNGKAIVFLGRALRVDRQKL